MVLGTFGRDSFTLQKANPLFQVSSVIYLAPIRVLMESCRLLTQRFVNAAEYNLEGVPIEAFINKLVATEHILVYTKSFEEHGLYVVAHPSLQDRPEMVKEMMRKAFHVHELAHTPQFPTSTSDDPDGKASGDGDFDSTYLLLLSPTDQFLWRGQVMILEETKVGHHLQPNRVRLIADGPQTRLALAKEAFNHICNYPVDSYSDSVFVGKLECIHEHASHITPVNKELRKVSRSLTKLIETIMTSAQRVQQGLKGVPKCQEIIASWFSFASEHGQQALKVIDPASSYSMSSMLTVLAISWVSFICDECDHTDRKTFRSAVSALEFALYCTRWNNILRIPDDQFNLLQQKVATCMSLLISHFDILGARSSMEDKEEKKRALELRRWQALDARVRLDEDESLSRPPSPGPACSILGPLKASYERKSRLNRSEVSLQIEEVEAQRIAVETEQHMVGRVLDIGIPEDRSLVDLVSSGTRMTMRWQQGRFIGAGAFGTVYQAINLTTGTIMAVKEIRYQELAGSNLFKQVKDELAIMELLHHPNIVEYYGIEAHRDKVYIFEEYCQGGSLARLLELGRIEDEGIIQIYTMQLLEGLIYLHSKGIIHRDLKPDSKLSATHFDLPIHIALDILLDHMGVIKYVDFGAAKVLAKNQRTIQRSRIAGTSTGTGSKMAPGLAMNNSLTGTPMYMAPEVIRNDIRGRHGAMDIWSLGCVVLECSTGRKPWSNLDNEW
jgi:mitogen-activated protein kinase kinase kinase